MKGTAEKLAATMAWLRNRRKNETAPAPELFLFMKMALDPVQELLIFMNIAPAPEISFFTIWLRLQLRILFVFTH